MVSQNKKTSFLLRGWNKTKSDSENKLDVIGATEYEI